MPAALAEMYETLTEQQQEKAYNFIFTMYQENVQKSNPKLANRKAGVLKDENFYMAPDFDETPECFKDYI